MCNDHKSRKNINHNPEFIVTCRPFIFQTRIYDLKKLKFTPSSCKDKEI